MPSLSPTGTSSPRPPGDLNPRSDAPLDFPDRDITEMSNRDYQTLGFLAGLEVHQQLLTRGKLFCRCPAGRRATKVDAEVLRHMRPTLSELGEYDGTALMEFKTHKEIVYLLDRDSVCTYEIDDTPPFEIDRQAVGIGLKLACLYNLQLVSELHVMRKQYLDGSIPTGFQRTAMLGLSGAIPFQEPALGVDRELRIRQLSLEEDSCREVSDEGHRITFRTDRLGMPLTEVVTEPDLYTPLEVQAGARCIARVAHTTGDVRRGVGAARQDVNVSVAGGRRIEIKGVAHQRGLPRLVHVEAFRQLNLLRLRAELHRQGVDPTLLRIPATGNPWEQTDRVINARGVVQRANFAPIQHALDRGDEVMALRLAGFSGWLNHRTQPGATFARELRDRVRVIACLTDRPFMIHSDITDYGLDPSQWRQLRSGLRADESDALVVLWGPTEDVATAVREVFIRAKEALQGVPAETRQAFADGTTGFERVLPGPDRMYPDTDTPPLPIADTWVAEIQTKLPEPPWDREARYRSRGLPFGLARRLAQGPWADLFDKLDLPDPTLATRMAWALENRLNCRQRRGQLSDPPAVSRVAYLVQAIAKGTMRVEALEPGLDALLDLPKTSPAEVLARFSPQKADEETLARGVGSLSERLPALLPKTDEAILRWAMGQVMPSLVGHLSPHRVRDAIREQIERTRQGDPG